MLSAILTPIYFCTILYIHGCLCESISSLHFTLSEQYRGRTANNPVVSKICQCRLACFTFCSKTGVHLVVMYDPTTSSCYCYDSPLSRLTYTDAAGVEVYLNLEPDWHELWITRILNVSSHFKGEREYPASSMLGVPDFYPRYGNNASAWCPAAKDAFQYIELGVDEAIYIREIHIYETFFAGGVKTVSILSPSLGWVKLWKTRKLEIIQHSRVFVLGLKPQNFRSDAVRLDLGLNVTNEWSEFDAVKVIGSRTKRRMRKI